eukprot:GHVO01032209.1.p1 GENE.GHVO01032209.1~~GHVO01032209.1.p1  ORF type:complete len:129 (+),score=21.41 GHVO01032209.1:225-611(+)
MDLESSVGDWDYEEEIAELRSRITDKDDLIKLQKGVIAEQQQLLEMCGVRHAPNVIERLVTLMSVEFHKFECGKKIECLAARIQRVAQDPAVRARCHALMRSGGVAISEMGTLMCKACQRLQERMGCK